MNPLLSPDITVKKLLNRYPSLIQLFMDFDLLCVGCPAEAFHTLSDVAREYNLNLCKLLQRIGDVLEDGKESQRSLSPKQMGEAVKK